MQVKKEAFLRQQSRCREEQLIKKEERQAEAAERLDEYRLFEAYLARERKEEDQRRTNILQTHIERKRLEANAPPSHDYCFTAARNLNRLKRKSSISSFSLDDNPSCTGSLNLIPTLKRNATRFDLMSPSLTAPTAASRSKMNRTASICNVNEHYNSFSLLKWKTTLPTDLFGGSLMNLSKMQNLKGQSSTNFKNQTFDDSQFSVSMGSLATSIAGRISVVFIFILLFIFLRNTLRWQSDVLSNKIEQTSNTLFT